MRTSVRPGVIEPEVVELTRRQLDVAVAQTHAAWAQVTIQQNQFKAGLVFGVVTTLIAALGLWLGARPDLVQRIEQQERHIAAIEAGINHSRQKTPASGSLQMGSNTSAGRGGAAAPDSTGRNVGSTQVRSGRDTPVVIGPRCLKCVEPRYPDSAQALRLYGSVLVTYVVELDGTVSNVSTEGNAILAPAVAEAVKQWTFVPALRNGQPVRVSIKDSVMVRPPPL